MWYRIIIILSLFVMLAACGGGDGGGNSNNKPVNTLSLLPKADSTDVDISTPISVKTQTAITNSQLENISFSMAQEETPIEGSIRLLNGTVQFVPNESLTYATTYKAHVEISDNSFAASDWSFTTMENPVPFEMTPVTDANGNVKVENGSLNFQLSAPLDTNGVTPGDLVLLDANGNEIPFWIHLSPEDNILRITPEDPLSYNTKYTLKLKKPWYSIDGREIQIDEAISVTTDADTYPPMVSTSYPINGRNFVARNVNMSLSFTEAINPDSVNAVLFHLHDIGNNRDLAFGVALSDNGTTVVITPAEPFVYNAEISLTMKPGLKDIANNIIASPYTVTFEVTPDQQGPQIVSVSPAEGDESIDTTTAFVVEFDENLDPSTIVADDKFLRLSVNQYSYNHVPTVATIAGNKLTIIPTEPMTYGKSYMLDLTYPSSSTIQDVHGNRSYNLQKWDYETVEYDNKIALGFAVDAFEVNKATNQLFALDKTNKQLAIINLDTEKLESTHQLIQIPSRLCIDNDGDRVYITNTSSTFITEYTLSSFEKVTDIPWSAKAANYDTVHYHISCDATHLYVTDADWSPLLYRIDRAEPYNETQLGGILSVGDFHLANTGDIYTWFQYGWGAGLASTKVQRFEEGVSEWTVIDSTNESYPQYSRDPLDAPLLIDEDSGLVINKRFVFNANNLEQKLYDFGENNIIYAADFDNERVATKMDVYSLENYRKVSKLPVINADGLFFDNDGDVYMIDNSRSAIYVLPASELNSVN